MDRNSFGERKSYDRDDFRDWLMQRDMDWKFAPDESPVAVYMNLRFARRFRAWLLDRRLADKIRNKRARIHGRLRTVDVVTCIDSITDI